LKTLRVFRDDESPTLPTNLDNGDKMKIRVFQIGDVQPNIIKIIVDTLNKRFKSKFVMDKKIDIPEEAYDKYRNQYNSEIILKSLKKHIAADEKAVGITSNDIYAKDLNFIFGQSYEDVCIVSTSRLDPKFYNLPQNFELLIKRTLKETIHEIGHMFGMTHCKNPECVMSFSNSIAYVDDKADTFCKDCTLKMTMNGVVI